MNRDPDWLARAKAEGRVTEGPPVRLPDPVRADRPSEEGYRAKRKPLAKRYAKPPGPSEDEFSEMVVQFAQLNGWACVHFRAARTGNGWRTPVSADGKGWVDWQFVRERVVYAELKTDKGRLTDEQKAWSDRLKAAGQEVYLWRPESWDEIKRTLGGSP